MQDISCLVSPIRDHAIFLSSRCSSACGFTDSSSVLAGLDDARTLESTKIAVQHWLHEIGTLVAQKDEVLLKSLERIKELEAMFNAAPSEDRLAA